MDTESHSETSFNTVEHCETISIPHTLEIKVSILLQKLIDFKENYFEKGTIPNLDSTFDLNLFNTFLCYIDHYTFFPFKLKLNTDERGSFVETVKLNSGGQVSFSTTIPGITRGNHFHTRKAERFAVIKEKQELNSAVLGQIKYILLNWMEENHRLLICQFGTPIISPMLGMKNYTPFSGSTSILMPMIRIHISKKYRPQCNTESNTVLHCILFYLKYCETLCSTL